MRMSDELAEGSGGKGGFKWEEAESVVEGGSGGEGRRSIIEIQNGFFERTSRGRGSSGEYCVRPDAVVCLLPFFLSLTRKTTTSPRTFRDNL
jgi:hypothetical protein